MLLGECGAEFVGMKVSVEHKMDINQPVTTINNTLVVK